MTEITEAIYAEGPGSLSNRLFLYRNGSLEDANATEIIMGEENARVISSPALIDLLGEIPEDA
jgi:hypothetical protein